MKTALRSAFATVVVAATTACADAASPPTSTETEALTASAPAWQPSDLTADLAVDEATRRRIGAGLRAMHASMLDLHERYEAALALNGAEEAAAMDALEADIRALHEQHRTLWASLDDDVARTLRIRMHEVMADHDDGTMQSLHERMRRVLGSVHDADGAGH